ncbi:MAG: YbfB/YjiJ family MFS transporter [Pseudomonadota bacterium]|nr:YbfB/YjiJ family MFS transporter [Pseudomonadota bacterium]
MPVVSSPTRAAAAGLVSLAAAMGIGRFAFTPLLPLMQQEGLLDVARGGELASVHFAGYLAGALAAGWLRLPPRPSLLAALGIIAVATLAMGLTENFILWLLLRFASGAASAFVLVAVSSHFISFLAEAGRAGLQGWVFAGVGAGIALAGLATLGIMAMGVPSPLAWQLFGWVSLAAVAAVLLLWPGDRGGPVRTKQTGKAARVPVQWPAVVAYCAAGLGYVIPATYLPVLAKETVSSPMIFGLGWPVFGAAAFVSTLISARLHARHSNRQVWAVSQLVMAGGLLLPVFAPHIAAVILSGLAVGGTFMIVTMAGMKEAYRIGGKDDAQRHIAVLTTSFAAGQMAGPAMAGWMREATGSFATPLIFTSILLAAAAFWLVRPAGVTETARP